jgi:hypothetical protein
VIACAPRTHAPKRKACGVDHTSFTSSRSLAVGERAESKIDPDGPGVVDTRVN